MRDTSSTDAEHSSAAAEPDDRRSVRHEIACTGERLLPWAVSLLLHIAVVLLALFVVWSAQPEAENQPDRPVTLNPTPDNSERLTRLGEVQTNETDLKQTASSPPRHPRTDSSPSELPVEQAGHSLPRPAEPNKPEPTGLNNTRSIGFLDGDDQTPGGDGPAADPPPGGRPGSVVFVIDASGSMVEQFSVVQRELGRAIRALGPNQRFTVIYFQQDRALEAKPRGLCRATSDNVQRFFAWGGESAGEIQPQGASNPMPALQLALAYRPDEIRLLSDNITGSGSYAVDVERLLSEVDRIKRQRRAGHTTIHTVQFLRPDPTGALERLAEQHGGMHRFVSAIGRD